MSKEQTEQTFRALWSGHENILRNLSERIVALEHTARELLNEANHLALQVAALHPPAVHALDAGHVLCSFSYDVPGKWPPGHRWVYADQAADVTCEGCKAILTARRGE